MSSETLTSLEGLPTLQNATLHIEGNQALTSLAGLEGYERLAFLKVYDNPRLTSLDGLENLTWVSTLKLEYTPIASLEGLSSLVEASRLVITDVDVASLAELTSCKPRPPWCCRTTRTCPT